MFLPHLRSSAPDVVDGVGSDRSTGRLRSMQASCCRRPPGANTAVDWQWTLESNPGKEPLRKEPREGTILHPFLESFGGRDFH